MELKSVVHWRYSANMISLFALTSQSHWFIFANFGNLSRFLKFEQIKTYFEKSCIAKIPQTFLNPVVLFDWRIILWIWIDISSFQNTNGKSYLKTCNFKVQCKKKFEAKIQVFLKTK